MTRTQTRELLLLRGATVLRADSLEEIAALGDDGLWRTPDGMVTDSVAIPEPVPAATITPAAVRAHDRAWVEASIEDVRELARRVGEITTDEVWAALRMPPREPRQIGGLMRACARAGLIRATDTHRRSTRRINNARPVRVWRSLLHADDAR